MIWISPYGVLIVVIGDYLMNIDFNERKYKNKRENNGKWKLQYELGFRIFYFKFP